MKYLKRPFFVLVLIIILAGILRLYNLGKVPQSLNWDEVSLGYNAYSILNTGKDEYGAFMPVVLRSYDDYKPALYAYLTIPFVAILGLTEVAVRLPSATAGIAAIVIVYFLVLELFSFKKVKILEKEIDPSVVALVTAFFVAISPWHIQFSRIAFESNIGLTLNLLAFLFFLKGIRKSYFLPLSFFIAAMNIHMYQSERVFSPLLIIALSVIFYKRLLRIKKWFIVSLITAFLVALPLVIYIATDSNALLRAKGVSIFSQQTLAQRSSIKLLNDEKDNNLIGKVLDNRRVEFVKATVGGYISHFDLNWLFITGDIARHHAPYMGLLYLFEFPLLFIGIYFLIFLKMDKSRKVAFFAYFLLVSVPASITSGVPHAVRTLNFVWTWELFIAIGAIVLAVFVYSLKKSIISLLVKAAIVCYLLFAFLNISYYLNQYFVQLNYYTAKDWLFGYKETVSAIEPFAKNFDKVIVENEVPFDQSYMFFLFYLKVDPLYYQNIGGTGSGGFKEEHKGFYNFIFRSIKADNSTGKVMLVGKPGDIPKNFVIQKIIYGPDGEAIVAIATNQ